MNQEFNKKELISAVNRIKETQFLKEDLLIINDYLTQLSHELINGTPEMLAKGIECFVSIIIVEVEIHLNRNINEFERCWQFKLAENFKNEHWSIECFFAHVIACHFLYYLRSDKEFEITDPYNRSQSLIYKRPMVIKDVEQILDEIKKCYLE